jgi:hypothetical protein
MMKKIMSLLLALSIASSVIAAQPENADMAEAFAAAEKIQQNGNVRDAFELYKKLLAEAPENISGINKYYSNAVDCLIQAGSVDAFDGFTAMALQKHGNSPEMLHAAAAAFMKIAHDGFLIGGQFIRGYSNGGGESVSAFERDRVFALRLLMKAINNSGQFKSPGKKQFYIALSQTLMEGRSNNNSYKLQYLTDISEIPPYDRTFGHFIMGRISISGAPVDSKGNPVFYKMPQSFELAANDGERWRLALAMAGESGYGNSKWDFALFLYRQFGAQTIGNLFNIAETTSTTDSPFAVQQLPEDETIARLAGGIKRFKLPDEFNYIKMFRELAASGDAGATDAMDILARIFTDRKQYKKAAEFWKSGIAAFGRGKDGFREAELEQITGNLGCFMQAGVFPAGKEPVLNFRYRNAPEANVEVYRVDIGEFISDIKNSLQAMPEAEKSSPHGISPECIGNWLLDRNEQKYRKQKLAAWKEKLDPGKDNIDAVAGIKIPLKQAGVYLVKASLPQGNISQQILWITDTVIAERSSGNSRLYVIMDAGSGKIIPGAELFFFGYISELISNPEEQKRLGRKFKVITHEFKAVANERGFYLLNANLLRRNYAYMVEVKTADGRNAVQGFSYFYRNGDAGKEDDALRKVFCITDCPVYRPGQKMFFKYWISNAGYGNVNVMDFAGKSCKVIITSPRGQKVFEKDMQADQFAALDGCFAIPPDAELGSYYIYIEQLGGYCSFRVEEYRKPEYEAQIDGPERPAKTGDSFNVTIKADYYFNAPVVNAKVKYKVMRYSQPENWVQPSPWNWLYGDGFIAGQAPAARPATIPYPNDFPPELVMENEARTDENGQLSLTIDTAPVKVFYGNIDCRYEISAEIADASLNTVAVKKTFITAGKPFKVYCWLDKGYYRTDNYAALNVRAVTADGKNVSGAGIVKIFKVATDKKGIAEETIEKEAKITLDENGGALKFRVGEPGQYRVICDVSDAGNNTIRSKCLLRVFGEKILYDDFVFNPVEIIVEKNEYRPGETAELIIGTEKKESTVLVFARASSENDSAIPEVFDISNKNATTSVSIRNSDMPNIFIEAWSVSDGRLNREVKQIIVPPDKKILKVAVTSAVKLYKPSQKAKITLKVTDPSGNPVKSARLVATGYDKAVEHISGGSNITDIKSFFWGWKRHYYEKNSCNLDCVFDNMLEKNQVALRPLGVLGDIFSAKKENGKPMVAGSRLMAAGGNKSGPPDAIASEAATDSITVRKNFADSLLWAANIQTDSSGEAELTFDFPDNLTAWKINAWAIGESACVGQGEIELVTSKDFLVRMETPRFLAEDDEVVIAGIVHNYEKNAESAKVVLRLEGDSIKSIDTAEREVTVPTGGNVRVDWRVRAFKKGIAGVEISAAGKNGSDAVKMELPVDIHGIEKQISCGGCLNDDSSGSAFVTFDVPANRIPESVQISVRYSPSIAISVVDALPYLMGTEGRDTISGVNRFVPAVTVAKALKKFDISLNDLKNKLTNLNSSEQGSAKERAERWKRFESLPVFDNDRLADYAAKSLETMMAMQNGDGGWGWFSGFYENSWADMTAYAARGLIIARDNGINVDQAMLSRGIAWLKAWRQARTVQLQSELAAKPPPVISNIDALVNYVLALAGQKDSFMTEQLYAGRSQLSLYGLTLCGLTLQLLGDKQKLDMILQNIGQFCIEDPENQTAYLKFPQSNPWWNWHGNEIETQAFYLKLLSLCKPKTRQPAWLAKYLVNNRKNSACWNSPRETALCVEAVADYFASSNEISSNINLEVYFDGQLKKQVSISPRNIFTYDAELLLKGYEVSSGRHTIELRRKGTGPLFFNASLFFFSLEKTIKSAQSDLSLERKYYKLVKESAVRQSPGIGGSPLLRQAEKYSKQPLTDGDQLKAGDLVEIEMLVNAKNDFEYVVVSDHKAAGFEPAEYLSGYCGAGLGAFVEYREREVSFYIRELPRGIHSLTYRVRAEFPGRFSALPGQAKAIYAPELRANSDENKVVIEQ